MNNISLNLATTRQVWGFAEAVDGCLRAGITAISPWRDQIAAIGLNEAARIVRDNKIQVTGVCRGGMFPSETAAGRARARRTCRARCAPPAARAT